MYIIAAAVIVIIIAGGYLYYQSLQPPSPSPSPSPSPETVDLRVSMYSEPVTIDPHKAAYGPDLVTMYNLYETLVYPLPSGEPEPILAEKWEVSNQGITYTFYLRENAVFHDGTPVEAKDIKFSMERMLALGKGFSGMFMGDYGVDSVTIINNKTVSINLKKPFAPFIMTLYCFPIMNMDLIESQLEEGDYDEWGDYGQDFLINNDAGSGAFKLQDWERGYQMIWARHDEYWQGWDNPKYPTTVYFMFIREDTTIKTMLLNKEIDFDCSSFSRDLVDTIREVPHLVIEQANKISTGYINLNTQKEPTSNIHFRKAVAYCFPYQEYVETVGLGVSKVARGPVNENVYGFDTTLPEPEFNLTKAKQELELSGYETPIEFHVTTLETGQDAPCLAWAPQLEKIGIQLIQHKSVLSLYFELTKDPQTSWHANVCGKGPNYPHADDILWWFTPYNWGQWYAACFYNNTEYEELIKSARAEADPEKALEIYHQCQEFLLEEQPAVWYTMSFGELVHQDYVTGFVYRPGYRTEYKFHRLVVNK